MRYKEAGRQFCEEINSFCEKETLKCALVTGGGYAYDSMKYENDELPNKDYDFMMVYESDVDAIISNLANKTHFQFDTRYLKIDLDYVQSGKVHIIRLSGIYRQFKATVNLVPISLIQKVSQLQNGIIKKIAHGRNTSLFFANGTNGNRLTTIFFSPFFKIEDDELHYVHLDFICKKESGHVFLGILADAVLKGYSKQFDAIGFYALRRQFIKNIYRYLKEQGTQNYRYESLFANWNYFSDSMKERLNQEFCEINDVQKVDCSLEKRYYKTHFLVDTAFTSQESAFEFIKTKPLKGSWKEYILQMQDTEYTRQYLTDAWGKFLAALYYECGAAYDTHKMHRKTVYDDEIAKYKVYGVNDLDYHGSNSKSYDCLLYFLQWLYRSQIQLNYEFVRSMVQMTVDFFETLLNIYIMNEKHLWNGDELDFLKRLSERTIIRNYTESTTFEEVAMLHNINSRVMPQYTKDEGEFVSKYFEDKKGAVLDVMCGVGRMANELHRLQYAHVYGIDQNDYVHLGVEKDFKFMKSTTEDFHTDLKFKYVMCLYNCYSDLEQLEQLLDKIYEISTDDAIVVLDVFNKEWRDNTATLYHHTLRTPQDYRVELYREYNAPIEKTVYRVIQGKEKTREFTFEQRFFQAEELEAVFSKRWNFEFANSQNASTRNNAQKLIYILKK